MTTELLSAATPAPLIVEPRCRICRDPSIRDEVDALLAWRGAPVRAKGKVRCITLAEIYRSLEHLNSLRRVGDRLTYTSLWNHTRRHFLIDGVMARVDARLQRDLQRLSEPCRTISGPDRRLGDGGLRR